MEKWLSEYNCERLHESLNNMTPEEYRQRHYLAGISKSVWNKNPWLTGRLTAKGASYRSQFVLEQEAFRGAAMSWG
jgi:hypothetical protein